MSDYKSVVKEGNESFLLKPVIKVTESNYTTK